MTTLSPPGGRGPTAPEDFHARENLTHFDHKRIPEWVVHTATPAHTAISRPTTIRLPRRHGAIQHERERIPVLILHRRRFPWLSRPPWATPVVSPVLRPLDEPRHEIPEA
ncbi:catalase [Amycolatopsis sulphurea]|uniref:catalase n=1 Tax=Amycolatopsis sulphurea TaxID=76022 RepID=UPI0011460392|nr:catalase [Amycolatopsis sulphurea]